MTSNTATLADQYAIIKAQAEALESQLKALRAEILATGQEVVIGDKAVIKVCLSERNTLDTKAAKSFLTEDEIYLCTKTTVVETLKVLPKL